MADRPAFFLLNPVQRSFRVSDPFNTPRAYTFAPDKKQLHEGIDLVAIDADRRPVAVLAAQRGIIDRIDFDARGYGNYVRIVHRWGADTYATWYAHMDSVEARVGEFVLPGAPLGTAGNTGFSSGIHLHLTLQYIGHGLDNYVIPDVVDPEPFFILGTPPAFDEATYAADVTIPDGTAIEAGQSFRKVWRVRNTGNTVWHSGYALRFAADDQMSGPDKVALETTVAPGQLAEVGVDLIAPNRAGTQRSTWQFRSADGDLFDYQVFAEINVEAVQETDRAAFVTDVTVPDGSIIEPGQPFRKVWRVRNTGTSTWNRDYTLRFARDDQMGGPERVNFPREVAPNATLDIAVNLTAPDDAGRHVSSWQLFNDEDAPFARPILYADILVPELEPPASFDEARFIRDSTIPDGTVLNPGQSFLKRWRIRNTGNTTWKTGYELAFLSGNQMGGPEAVPLPSVGPGRVAIVSVPLVSPAQPGTYKGIWKPRNASGAFFDFELDVSIEVEQSTGPVDVDELRYVADVTIPDGTRLSPGQQFVKTWRVRNTGTTTWGAGHRLAFYADNKMSGPNSVALPSAGPGDEVEVSVTLTAPTQVGTHKSTWRGRNPAGEFFDGYVFALITVYDPDTTFDMLEYLRGDGRVYDVAFDWAGGGIERMQTQRIGNRFYHVKNRVWEELWADQDFIYRGADISGSANEIYLLMENGSYGSAWNPRFMQMGVMFRRSPLVVFRRRDNGGFLRQFTQVTWIVLENVYPTVRFPTGVTLNDVAVMAAYEDFGGQPKPAPFERYLYAKNYGLVGWAGPLGRSFVTDTYPPGSIPDLEREILPWLNL